MAYLQGCFKLLVLQCGSNILACLLHSQSMVAPGMTFDLKSELVMPRCALCKVIFFQAKWQKGNIQLGSLGWFLPLAIIAFSAGFKWSHFFHLYS